MAIARPLLALLALFGSLVAVVAVFSGGQYDIKVFAYDEYGDRGSVGTLVPGLGQPAGVAADGAGYVYIAGGLVLVRAHAVTHNTTHTTPQLTKQQRALDGLRSDRGCSWLRYKCAALARCGEWLDATLCGRGRRWSRNLGTRVRYQLHPF